MNQSIHKNPLGFGRWLPWVVLLTGIGLTLYATYYASRTIDEQRWLVPVLLFGDALLTVVLFYMIFAEGQARRRVEKSEEALRRSEEWLKLILESATDFAIFSTDLQGRVTSWNTGAERLFGYTEEEILGQNARVIFTPEDREKDVPETELMTALARGSSSDDRYHQRKDGTRLFVSGVVRPMRDPSGKPVGFIKIARDVTERMQAEERILGEKQFSDTLINSLPGTFYLFEYTGKLLRWNENTERVSGYNRDEISRMTPLDFIPAADRPRVAESIERVVNEGQATVAADLLTKDGRRIPYLYSGCLIVLNGVPCVTGMGVDISDQKRAEEESHQAEARLRNYAVKLEERVEQRTAHLQQSLESLEGVLYHVAHDLRAPLRAMASFTNILLSDHAQQLDNQGRDYARRISLSAQRMDELVQDLLAYGRLAHTAVPLRKVNLESEVETVVGQFSEEIKARHAEVQVQHPLPPVKANPAILNEVISHLLSNALKFVQPGTSPQVRIGADAGERIRLWIEDNGIGIRPEYQERIFRVFERLHGADMYSGTGIGLAIARKGVARMGGSVGVESTPGKGSRFWLDLPLPDSKPDQNRL